MRRFRSLVVALWAVACLPALAAAEEDFPRPDGLEPNVRFWTRIYSEIDSQAGLIHDADHLEIVYEAVHWPEGLSSRSRERRVEKAKRHIRDVLRTLASGKRSNLSAEEQRILGRWPEGVSNATLREASRNVRFQLGQADRFRAGIVRSGAWRAYIEKILRERGLPVELAALPHVESSYNPRAYSRVGAAGLWQFTRSTGRLYLRVDNVVDERMDPFAATVAAARLLRHNYGRLESWPLAITAYNHGVGGMDRAVRRLGTRDIAEISRRYRSRSFGFASRNFYAEFLAALDVDRNAEAYFGPLHRDTPVDYELVSLDYYVPVKDLVRALGVRADVLHEHNLALRPAVWNGAKYVPKDFALRVPRAELTRPVQVALNDVPAGVRFAQQHRDRYYKVRRGDTLSRIASRYGVRESELVGLNNLRSRHRIRVGQVLILPDSALGGSRSVARAEPPADGVYRVQRGDTLSRIAARFGVSQSDLVALNGLRNRHQLAVGQPLRLPGVFTASAPSPAPKPKPTPPPATAPVAPPPAPKPAEPPAEAEAEAEPAPPTAPAPPAAEPPAPPEPAVASAPVPAPDTGAAAPDPSNYAVSPGGRVTVQAEETLGHYAEWLELPTSHLRRVNGMKYGTPLVIGRRVKLDFGRVDADTFEQRRLAYHQAIQEQFFDSYLVTGTETYTLRRGDTLWYLAERKLRVPVWLLRQYNPDLDFGSLPAGARLTIPRIEPRRG